MYFYSSTKTDKYDILNIPDRFVVYRNNLKNHIKFKYLIMTFIPPENSLYSSINAFLDIENELVNFIEKDMKCALVGDFNAKTAVLEVFQNHMKLFLMFWM